MRRRKLLIVLGLAGLAVLVAAGVVGTFLLLLPTPAVRATPENYSQISTGMSHAKVEAILGPPGDYRTGPTDGELTSSGSADPGGECLTWRSDVGPSSSISTQAVG